MLMKTAAWLGAIALTLLLALAGFLWLGNYHPAAVEDMVVDCADSAPSLQAGQSLEVLTWNVQTMSGKNYVFWSDLPNNDGPHEKPSREDIDLTFEELVRAIRDEDPDILLLQEIDQGAERTYYEDQLARLIELLPDAYACTTSAFDWKSVYVPHPRIHGSVGWKVAILSKYRIDSAERLSLPTAQGSAIEALFKIKPAVLKAHLPISGGGEFVAMTVHLDLTVPGSNAKELQLAEMHRIFASLSQKGIPWLIGGDFNLLPPGTAAYDRLPSEHRKSYSPQSEIEFLFDRHRGIPGETDLNGPDYAGWFTRWPNDPAIAGPDRTLDYFFVSDSVAILDYHIRIEDTLDISDHLPLTAEVRLP
jgi:endonuclease/exonuclease/phosphatase family metal-dependent hydrolase